LRLLFIILYITCGKNDFAKVSKNLARYRSGNNFVQNNYVERLSINNNAAKSFNIPAISYFDPNNY